MPLPIDNSHRGYVAVAVLFALVAVLRILSSYSHTAQAFDEPYHVGAAIEFLDKGTYTLDPVHPPLQRIAVGLPLYIAGERYPNSSLLESFVGQQAVAAPLASVVGNAILNDGGHYMRNLALARLGVLPFLLLGCVVVFLWARREYGDFAGLAAVALFATLPPVLAFSSVAYTDIVAATTQAAACWAFATWLDRGNWRSTLWMGVAMGFAMLAKTTTYIFLPAAALSMVVLKWAVLRKTPLPTGYKQAARQVATAGAIAMVMLWAGYGFAVGHVRESMQISAESIPSFQHFPALAGKIGRDLMIFNPRVPAPALIQGLAIAWIKDKAHPANYLLGQIKPGGYWYFFPVAVGVKSTIPFLVLILVGLFSFRKLALKGRWTVMAPAACTVAILLVTMPVALNAGVRHVLVVFPLLAVVAGCGCAYLWNWPRNWHGDLRERQRVWGRGILVALLLWQCVSTVRASSNYLAYFNELAGNGPDPVLLAGCDLDCGQDLFALSREFQARHVSHASLALWTSADMSKMGMPEFDVPQPYQPVTGWFAISLRALRLGEVFHSSYPRDAFGWLNRYHPVARVGKTILLYYIPEEVVRSKTE